MNWGGLAKLAGQTPKYERTIGKGPFYPAPALGTIIKGKPVGRSKEPLRIFVNGRP